VTTPHVASTFWVQSNTQVLLCHAYNLVSQLLNMNKLAATAAATTAAAAAAVVAVVFC